MILHTFGVQVLLVIGGGFNLRALYTRVLTEAPVQQTTKKAGPESFRSTICRVWFWGFGVLGFWGFGGFRVFGFTGLGFRVVASRIGSLVA